MVFGLGVKRRDGRGGREDSGEECAHRQRYDQKVEPAMFQRLSGNAASTARMRVTVG